MTPCLLIQGRTDSKARKLKTKETINATGGGICRR